jgi:hypothetical protein
VDRKSGYIERAVKIEAQAKKIGEPIARDMLQALTDALYQAAGPESDPSASSEIEGAALHFRRKAEALRGRISSANDPEIVRQLGKLADEYELLASAVEALCGKAIL